MSNDKIIYRPKKRKAILLGLTCLVFMIFSLFLFENEQLKAWFIFSFFGLGLLVSLVQLIPGSTELELTKEGFIITSLFRKSLITNWNEVKSFKIGYLGRNKTIMIDYVDGHSKHEAGKLIAKALSGSHGALPSTFGLKAEELFDIMNNWKRKYGTRTNIYN